MSARAYIDTIRSLGFAGISGTYAVIGSPFAFPVRLICFTNNTDADLMFTDDDTKDKIIVVAGGFKLFDVQSNMNAQFDDKYVLPIGTQLYVKRLEAITEGTAYVEVFY